MNGDCDIKSHVVSVATPNSKSGKYDLLLSFSTVDVSKLSYI